MASAVLKNKSYRITGVYLHGTIRMELPRECWSYDGVVTNKATTSKSVSLRVRSCYDCVTVTIKSASQRHDHKLLSPAALLCANGDSPFQWESAKFDPPAPPYRIDSMTD